MVCRDCLGRTPFATLIATIIVCVGVGIFCGTLHRAIEITLKGIFDQLFSVNVPWLESIQIGFLMVAVGMGVFAFLLLVFSFLATGATRQNIYSGAKCIMGGRVSAAFFLVVTYIMNFVWMCVTSVCSIPILIYVMLTSICEEEVQNKQLWYYDNYCFNLSRFGIYFNETEGVTRNALCDENDLTNLCQFVSDAGPLYSLAFGASLLVVLGMVIFLLTLGTNYQRIKMSKELSEYRDAVDLEMTETKVLENQRAHGFT